MMSALAWRKRMILTASCLQLKIFEVLREHFKLPTTDVPFGSYLVGLAAYVEDARKRRDRERDAGNLAPL